MCEWKRATAKFRRGNSVRHIKNGFIGVFSHYIDENTVAWSPHDAIGLAKANEDELEFYNQWRDPQVGDWVKLSHWLFPYQIEKIDEKAFYMKTHLPKLERYEIDDRWIMVKEAEPVKQKKKKFAVLHGEAFQVWYDNFNDAIKYVQIAAEHGYSVKEYNIQEIEMTEIPLKIETKTVTVITRK